jgi:cyclase
VLIPRVIPVMLLSHGKVVKTTRFKAPAYVGDPINTVRIFNDKQVDELFFLDITASRERREPDEALLSRLVDECFMPIAYGGGVSSVDQMRRLFGLGIEKVVVNTAVLRDPDLVDRAASVFGSQSMVVSLDARRRLFSGYEIVDHCGRVRPGRRPEELARQMQERGAGEILLTAIHREGTRKGYDLELTRRMADAVDVPLVANGGAGSLDDICRAIDTAGASAAAAGSLFVFKGPHKAVLVNYPARETLERALCKTTTAPGGTSCPGVPSTGQGA